MPKLGGTDSKYTPDQKIIISFMQAYKSTWAKDYKNTCQVIKLKRAGLINKYAEMPDSKGNDLILRKLGEMPSILHALYQSRLSKETLSYFESLKGTKWFYKEFPEFRITTEI